jgi:hypothetical protein
LFPFRGYLPTWRIPISSILHEVFYSCRQGIAVYFKEPAIHPGSMQKSYLEGGRISISSGMRKNG